MPPRKTTTEETETEKVDSKEELYHQNMRFYGLVQDTPKEAQKSFNNGRFSGTDINPMWRIKKLTEVFGPCGFGWWTQNVKYEFVEADVTPQIDNQPAPKKTETAVFCELELIVRDPETKEISQPIYGVGGNTFVAQRKSGPQASDEAKKMAYTDALSIACKALGFSHDIYFQADKTKYTAASIDAEPTMEDFKNITDRIQKGIAFVTKNMSAEEKDALSKNVVVKHIGSVNYMTCRDMSKLQALLDELLSMCKKPA